MSTGSRLTWPHRLVTRTWPWRVGTRLVLTAGGVPLDAEGNLVGAGDVAAQTRQVIANLIEQLRLGGATPEDVLKTTVYVAATDNPDLVTAWNEVQASPGASRQYAAGRRVPGLQPGNWSRSRRLRRWNDDLLHHMQKFRVMDTREGFTEWVALNFVRHGSSTRRAAGLSSPRSIMAVRLGHVRAPRPPWTSSSASSAATRTAS